MGLQIITPTLAVSSKAETRVRYLSLIRLGSVEFILEKCLRWRYIRSPQEKSDKFKNTFSFLDRLSSMSGLRAFRGVHDRKNTYS